MHLLWWERQRSTRPFRTCSRWKGLPSERCVHLVIGSPQNCCGRVARIKIQSKIETASYATVKQDLAVQTTKHEHFPDHKTGPSTTSQSLYRCLKIDMGLVLSSFSINAKNLSDENKEELQHTTSARSQQLLRVDRGACIPDPRAVKQQHPIGQGFERLEAHSLTISIHRKNVL